MKLKAAYETEVYITKNGYYAIRQESPLDEKNPIILLTRDQVVAISGDMKESLDLAIEWGESEEQ